MPSFRNEFTKVKGEVMSDEECYLRAFPFDKMVPGVPGPGLIGDKKKSSTRHQRTKSMIANLQCFQAILISQAPGFLVG